jgi:hypothetical protein
MKEQRSPAVKHINVNLNIGLLHSFEGCATLLGRTPRATQSKTSRGGVDVDPLAASVAPFLIGRRHHRRSISARKLSNGTPRSSPLPNSSGSRAILAAMRRASS